MKAGACVGMTGNTKALRVWFRAGICGWCRWEAVKRWVHARGGEKHSTAMRVALNTRGTSVVVHKFYI